MSRKAGQDFSNGAVPVRHLEGKRCWPQGCGFEQMFFLAALSSWPLSSEMPRVHASVRGQRSDRQHVCLRQRYSAESYAGHPRTAASGRPAQSFGALSTDGFGSNTSEKSASRSITAMTAASPASSRNTSTTPGGKPSLRQAPRKPPSLAPLHRAPALQIPPSRHLVVSRLLLSLHLCRKARLSRWQGKASLCRLQGMVFPDYLASYQ